MDKALWCMVWYGTIPVTPYHHTTIPYFYHTFPTRHYDVAWRGLDCRVSPPSFQERKRKLCNWIWILRRIRSTSSKSIKKEETEILIRKVHAVVNIRNVRNTITTVYTGAPIPPTSMKRRKNLQENIVSLNLGRCVSTNYVNEIFRCALLNEILRFW
jgi:hypothetical protein